MKKSPPRTRRTSTAPPAAPPRSESQSGMRQRSLPQLTGDDTPDAALEEQLYTLLTLVEQQPGFEYPPSWAAVAHVAKHRGWLNENGLRLYLANHGAQALALRARANDSAQRYTMTKVDRVTRLALKDLSHDTGVPMQEAIAHIIQTVHRHRDDLTRAARAAGLDHPWEGIGALLRGKR